MRMRASQQLVDGESRLTSRCPFDDLHSVDYRVTRTLAAPGQHGLDLCRWPLKTDAHGAIGLVARPAADSKAIRLLLARGAEEDTLNEAVYDGLSSDHARRGHGSMMPRRDEHLEPSGAGSVDIRG